MLCVRTRGDRDPRQRARYVARRPPAHPLSAVRWSRVRSRAATGRGIETRKAAVLAASPFDPLYRIIGWLLALLYAVPPHNLGLAIIVLTLIVMAVQFPLIAKQTRSMIQMQRVQPEIKKLQQKYKDDRAKQNEELLKFYQENKINPLAGCLPLLLILPIGIAVFGTFRSGVQQHVPRTGSLNALYKDICTETSNHPPIVVNVTDKDGVKRQVVKVVLPKGTLLPPTSPHDSTVESCNDHIKADP